MLIIMKSIFITLFVAATVGTVSAQSIDNKVMAGAGKSYVKPTAQLEFTMGEPFVKTLTKTQCSISQGFHQPSLTVVQVVIDADGNMEEVDGSIDTNLRTELPARAEINVYPNPATDYVNITISGEEFHQADLHLYDMQGKLVGQMELNGNSGVVDFTEMTPGNYILHLNSKDGSLKGTYRIVKAQ